MYLLSVYYSVVLVNAELFVLWQKINIIFSHHALYRDRTHCAVTGLYRDRTGRISMNLKKKISMFFSSVGHILASILL